MKVRDIILRQPDMDWIKCDHGILYSLKTNFIMLRIHYGLDDWRRKKDKRQLVFLKFKANRSLLFSPIASCFRNTRANAWGLLDTNVAHTCDFQCILQNLGVTQNNLIIYLQKQYPGRATVRPSTGTGHFISSIPSIPTDY